MKPIDLERGVVPISRAASSLAALIKRARADQQPIIITQKGYPSGVLLGIELFTALQNLAAHHAHADGEPEGA
jgi:prevent-host-death family protein